MRRRVFVLRLRLLLTDIHFDGNTQRHDLAGKGGTKIGFHSFGLVTYTFLKHLA